MNLKFKSKLFVLQFQTQVYYRYNRNSISCFVMPIVNRWVTISIIIQEQLNIFHSVVFLNFTKSFFFCCCLSRDQGLIFLLRVKGIESLRGHKLKFLNANILAKWCKPLICQTQIVLSKNIHSLKYLSFTTLGCRDIGIRKSEIVTKTQFL